MLYLLQSAEFKENESGEYEFFFSLKIGYTDDENTDLKNNKRLNMYFAHHRTIKLLATISNGTEEQEKKLHYKFKDLRWDDSNEWYIFDQNIIDYFKSTTVAVVNKLHSNPIRGDQKVLKGKRETRSILSYLFDTKDEIENYLSNLLNILGDSISFNTSLEYIKSDPSINQDKLNHFLNVKECKETGNYTEDEILNNLVFQFFKQYEELTTKRSKLKYLCECGLPKQAINIILSQIPDSDEIKSYYVNLGPERLFELGYITSRIEKELGIITFSEDLLRESIYSNFNIGDKLQLTEIKNKLSDIYNKINYSAAPKATDISEFFNVKSVQISIIDDAGKKKRVHGYEILSVK